MQCDRRSLSSRQLPTKVGQWLSLESKMRVPPYMEPANWIYPLPCRYSYSYSNRNTFNYKNANVLWAKLLGRDNHGLLTSLIAVWFLITVFMYVLLFVYSNQFIWENIYKVIYNYSSITAWGNEIFIIR